MVLAIAVVGLLFGSFVNAAVWRLHENNKAKNSKLKSRLNIFNGRSMCPHCRHQLAPIDLIPVFSWLALGGRCRYCKKPISWQYPIVELLTAGLFGLSLLAWNPHASVEYLAFGFWLVTLVGLLILAIYDLRWMILPDVVTLPLIILGAIRLPILLTMGEPLTQVFNYIWAAVLAGGFFYGLFALGKGKWMGGGDVKLAFLMGLILGTGRVLLAVVLAFNIAALVGIGLIVLRKANRKSLLPFGPFLILSTVVAALYGEKLIHLYLRLVNVY